MGGRAGWNSISSFFKHLFNCLGKGKGIIGHYWGCGGGLQPSKHILSSISRIRTTIGITLGHRSGQITHSKGKSRINLYVSLSDLH